LPARFAGFDKAAGWGHDVIFSVLLATSARAASMPFAGADDADVDDEADADSLLAAGEELELPPEPLLHADSNTTDSASPVMAYDDRFTADREV